MCKILLSFTQWPAEKGWTAPRLQRMSLRFTASPATARNTVQKVTDTDRELELWALTLLDMPACIVTLSEYVVKLQLETWVWAFIKGLFHPNYICQHIFSLSPIVASNMFLFWFVCKSIQYDEGSFLNTERHLMQKKCCLPSTLKRKKQETASCTMTCYTRGNGSVNFGH